MEFWRSDWKLFHAEPYKPDELPVGHHGICFRVSAPSERDRASDTVRSERVHDQTQNEKSAQCAPSADRTRGPSCSRAPSWHETTDTGGKKQPNRRGANLGAASIGLTIGHCDGMARAASGARRRMAVKQEELRPKRRARCLRSARCLPSSWSRAKWRARCFRSARCLPSSWSKGARATSLARQRTRRAQHRRR